MPRIPGPTIDNWIGRHRPVRTSRRGLYAAAIAGALATLFAERVPRWLGFGAAAPAPVAHDSTDSTVHVLGSTSQIPVGGGKIFRAQKVVVTQPAAGTFKAFNAVCTHAGCIVDSVADRKINCPCHPGVFRIDDGTAVSGPPRRPLAPAVVSVRGDQLYLHA